MDETKETEKVKENSISKKTNWWMISTIVLAIALVLVYITGGITGGVVGVSTTNAEQSMLDFLNARTGGGVEIVETNEQGAFYEIIVEYQGQEIPVYMTKDGEYFVQGLTPLNEEPLDTPPQTQTQQQTQTPSQEYSEEDLIKLKEFNDCLGEKGLKIYGANWCGWTKKLAVETLGGFDTAEAAYIECTENEELCASEGVKGYPTVKINGEVYQGARTIEALAEATSCPAPELEGEVAQASPDSQDAAQCG